MTTDRFPKARTLVCVLAMLLLASLASAGGAMAMPAYEPAPSVSSDKADYAPGELVTLSGASWGAGEVVHIRVNDDAGSSWSRDVDVTADDAGVIADSFNLPGWFVAEYSVTATGASGSVATTSFTDGNVKVAVVGGTAPIIQTLYTTAGCSGAIKNGFPMTVTIPPTDTVGVGSSESLRLDAPATANGGGVFSNWSKPAGGGLVFTPIAGTNGRSVCVAGFQSGSEDIIATYEANSARRRSQPPTRPSRSTRARPRPTAVATPTRTRRQCHDLGVARHRDQDGHELGHLELVLRDHRWSRPDGTGHDHGERRQRRHHDDDIHAQRQ